MTTTTVPTAHIDNLRTISDVANALSWSAELREQHPALHAALASLIEAHGQELEAIAQNWGTEEF